MGRTEEMTDCQELEGDLLDTRIDHLIDRGKGPG